MTRTSVGSMTSLVFIDYLFVITWPVVSLPPQGPANLAPPLPTAGPFFSGARDSETERQCHWKQGRSHTQVYAPPSH
jgi:hypothetical protein